MTKDKLIEELKKDIKRWSERVDNATNEFELKKATTYLRHYREELRAVEEMSDANGYGY